jgi:hypothetical protein
MSNVIETIEREHSGIVGGSTAGRMLNCPAHYRIITRMQEQLDGEANALIEKAEILYNTNDPAKAAAIKNAEGLRASLNKSSSYADEGTKLHQVMEYLVDSDVDPNTVMADATVDRMFDELEIDDKRMLDAVVPAYNMYIKFLDEILAEDGDEFLLRVETRVTFPGIEDAFGTCDVLIRTSKRTVVWDWKFGAGIPVAASYTVNYVNGSGEPDPYETGNDQLMFYARAALATHPDYFGVEDGNEAANEQWPVELVICQPRVNDEIGRFTTDLRSLFDFEQDMQDAVTEALTGERPQMKIGKWCDFAACKAQCPLHLNGAEAGAAIAAKLKKLQMQTATTRDVALSSGETVPAVAVMPHGDAMLTYPEALSTMLELADIAEPYFAEARKQAHIFMEAGGEVPDYKLVPKRAGWDSWEDETKAEQFLARQGLSLEERRKPMEPISPAKARTALKAKGDAKGLKLVEKYIKPGVSSGTNIARADNPREGVQPATVEALANKLKKLGAA